MRNGVRLLAFSLFGAKARRSTQRTPRARARSGRRARAALALARASGGCASVLYGTHPHPPTGTGGRRGRRGRPCYGPADSSSRGSASVVVEEGDKTKKKVK